MLDKDLHLLKASLPIYTTLLGITILFKGAPLKAHSPIIVKLSGRKTLQNCVCSKALLQIIMVPLFIIYLPQQRPTFISFLPSLL